MAMLAPHDIMIDCTGFRSLLRDHLLPPTGEPSDSSAERRRDSAIGSPYFQSISLGFECAMYLADLLAQRMIITDVYDKYEILMYKQWLRVYMRTKVIKHNKDIFERLDDTFGVLEQLHIY
jgi:hypothetical protein